MLRLKGDLHVHSTASDGSASPKELVLEAIRRGLGVLAVSDHDTFAGSLAARRYAESLGVDLVVLIAAEVRTAAGDVLVYCSDEPLERLPREPGELLDYAHEYGCIVVPAHPFDRWRSGIGELVYEYKWDAIEVFNAHAPPEANRLAEEAARKLGLPGLASSDAHVPEALASAYTLIEVEEAAPEEVLEAIRRGRVHPHPGRPGLRAVAHAALWSVKRRLRRGRRGGEEWLELGEEGEWMSF